MPTFVTPYQYAKLAGVSPQAINQRIERKTIDVVEVKGIDGSIKRYVDIEKYPPENKSRK